MKVYTENEFEFTTACVGDLVEQKVVDNIANVLPPAYMTSRCTQLGEPYSHVLQNGKWKATYATFKRISENVWEYCGHCFLGENIAVL